MAFFSPRRAQASLLHVVIWGLIAVLVFTEPAWGLPPSRYYLLQTALFAVLLSAFYLNVGWAVPQLLNRDRLLPYVGFLVATALAVVLAHRGGQYLLKSPPSERLSGERVTASPPRLPGPGDRPAPGEPGTTAGPAGGGTTAGPAG